MRTWRWSFVCSSICTQVHLLPRQVLLELALGLAAAAAEVRGRRARQCIRRARAAAAGRRRRAARSAPAGACRARFCMRRRYF